MIDRADRLVVALLRGEGDPAVLRAELAHELTALDRHLAIGELVADAARELVADYSEEAQR